MAGLGGGGFLLFRRMFWKQKLKINQEFLINDVMPERKKWRCTVINKSETPKSYRKVGLIAPPDGEKFWTECHEKAFYLPVRASRNHKLGSNPDYYLTNHSIREGNELNEWLKRGSYNVKDIRTYIENAEGKKYYSKSGNPFKDCYFRLKIIYWKVINNTKQKSH